MLNLSGIEFFFRGLPEGFLFIFAVYAFSHKKLKIKNFLFSGIIIAIIVYLIRMLPIHFGVHVLVSMIFIIYVSVIINGIDIKESIKGTMLVILLEFLCEMVNVFIIQKLIKHDIDMIFIDPILKVKYGIPSLVLLGLIIFSYYKLNKKRVV